MVARLNEANYFTLLQLALLSVGCILQKQSFIQTPSWLSSDTYRSINTQIRDEETICKSCPKRSARLSRTCLRVCLFFLRSDKPALVEPLWMGRCRFPVVSGYKCRWGKSIEVPDQFRKLKHSRLLSTTLMLHLARLAARRQSLVALVVTDSSNILSPIGDLQCGLPAASNPAGWLARRPKGAETQWSCCLGKSFKLKD